MNHYEVIIIGTGVVGCAMARQFAIEGASVLAVEKGPDILNGASKGNSAILHTGFDAPAGSIEHSCIVEGYQEYLNIRDKLGLPLLTTGALVTAWTEDEESKLEGILEKALVNGVHDAELLSARSIRKREPELSPRLRAGISIPREYVIDPWTAPFSYMLQALENGAELQCNCEVLSGKFDGSLWTVKTTQGIRKAKVVINCGGLYGDLLDEKLIGQKAFSIRPRKGQFVVYDKSASQLIGSIVLPVPNEITKGVVVCRTAFGNLLVGPTAEEQDSRDDASVLDATLRSLCRQGESIVPALAGQPITATFAGIRPATEFKDYCIRTYKEKHYISVGGIRSTGLSAALGIAKYVFDDYQVFDQKHFPSTPCIWPTVQQIAEHTTRDWQTEGNEGIVCHCELVTQREIKQALTGKLAAGSLAGLKRRTRATMGRCQGFYCSARLSELTKGFFELPIASDISQKGSGNE
ncbi:MAG: NAD(P)/FAD-dependent oxidoreductase [Gammaproteobacteria bacterium]|nr:NAD(P)/FAD-dependent oxidoreductase [Gammaproteobacteria bacterium]